MAYHHNHISMEAKKREIEVMPLSVNSGSQNIWQCLETFLVITMGNGGGATDMWWVESKDAAQYILQRTGQPLQQRIVQLKCQ